MRQTHAGGDKLFIDYAGNTVPVILNRLIGKTRPASIVIAVLLAPGRLGIGEAGSPELPDWI